MSGNVKFRWFLLASIVLSFLNGCTSNAIANNTSSPLHINTSSDVVTGTGFLFSSSNYVITSYGVIHGAKSIKVRLVSGEKIDATVALKDINNDIVILKLSQSPRPRQNIITLGDSLLVKTGDRVFTYGFPLVDLLGNAEPRYSEGFINSLSGISNDPTSFQVSIPIQPGYRGSPLFDEKGGLIGIATSSIDTDTTKKVFGSPHNINFAIKSSYIKSLLPNLPGALIRDKEIVAVPAKQVGFMERVKNDIVLVEAVLGYKPVVVKSDDEDAGRLSEEREREVKLEGEGPAKCEWEREPETPGEETLVCIDYSKEPRVQGYELCPPGWHDKFVEGVYSEGEGRNKEQVRSGICVHNANESRQCKAGTGCRRVIQYEQCLWDEENVYFADMYGEGASWYPCEKP